MLKQVILILCLTLGIEFLVEAQTQSGRMYFGGTANWNKSENKEDDPTKEDIISKKLTIQPLAGLFIKDNLAMGLFINYEYIRETRTYPVEKLTNIISTIATGPFVRKFIPINNIFAFYVQGMLGYKLNKTSNEYGMSQHHNHFNQTGLMVALKPGFTFFATNKIGIDLSVQGLQYDIAKIEDSEETNYNFNVDFNLPSVNLGCNLYIGR